MISKAYRSLAILKLQRGLVRATEAAVLYPAMAILFLAVIWGTTLYLLRVERASAERAAVESSRELAETYEAQVVRALREIDQTLKLVKYGYELRDQQFVLQDLKLRTLLPPELLFIVSIADSNGVVLASTRPSVVAQTINQAYFRKIQQRGDGLSVDRIEHVAGAAAGERTVHFGRGLTAVDGTFAGAVVLAVDQAYFVSSYDAKRMGRRGMLGILGADGVFNVKRSGDTVLPDDDLVAYPALLPPADSEEPMATLSVNTWDGVRRYTNARRLYEFPLSVIVGLSEDEQLAAMRRDMRGHLWRAAVGSILLIAAFSILGRLSRQLALSRKRATEEQIAHAKRVEHLAYHDGLTALPNRSLFSKLLGQSIQEAQRYDRHLAVLFLDLDRFKQINDTLGHEAGDELLQEVAIRLRSCLRDSDTVARLGGDEFVVLLPAIDEERYVATVAQKILHAVARPFVLIGHEFRITASIGISTYPDDGLDEQTLTKNADIAMYQAKGRGKNNFQFYSETLNAYSLERLTLESGLRHALECNEFELYYQPKRNIRTGRITGMEALLRWQHPDLGTIAPMRFIPVAEETGLIVPIGKWVLRKACLQNMAWRMPGLPALRMSVNVTMRQFFDDHLLSDLAAILQSTGMEANLLELEITESLLMRDVEKTLGVLSGLRGMGVRIAVDDFGIGYSSLATLNRFPLDTIKIDRSFIRDMAGVDEDRSLTEAVIAMGRTLSLTVVAQGVETQEQAEFLRRNACDEFQGFYVNKPMTADQIGDLLQSQTGGLGKPIRPHALRELDA